MKRRKFFKTLGVLGAALFVAPNALFSLPVKRSWPDLGKTGFVNWKTYLRSSVLNDFWMERVN